MLRLAWRPPPLVRPAHPRKINLADANLYLISLKFTYDEALLLRMSDNKDLSIIIKATHDRYKIVLIFLWSSFNMYPFFLDKSDFLNATNQQFARVLFLVNH